MNDGVPTVTISEAAKALGISEWAVRRRIKAGKLQATLVGREWRVALADSLSASEEPQDASEQSLAVSATALEALAEALAEANVRASDERKRVAELEQERSELYGRLGFYQARIQELERRVLELEAPKEAPAEIANRPSHFENRADSGSQKVSSRPWWQFWRWSET